MLRFWREDWAFRRTARLLASTDPQWIRQCEATLLAEGIACRWVVAEVRGGLYLEVPSSQADRSVSVLSEQLAEELGARPERDNRVPTAPIPLLLQPAFATALCLGALLLVGHGAQSGTLQGTQWFDWGALVPALAIEQGEWHRLVTAACLHADWAHALGNAGPLLVVAWAVGERMGLGAILAVWLLTAVAGFAFWLLVSDGAASVGASGGVFGLLGAAGGHGMRYSRARQNRRRSRLRALGGAVLLLAWLAFGPKTAISAHVGGFMCGVLIGLGSSEKPPSTWFQLVLGGAVCAVVVASWAAAIAGGSAGP